MSKRNQPLPRALERAVRRFEKWRKQRSRWEIPEELWDLATQLAVEYGLHRTKAALRLNYYDLKRRVEAASSERSVSVGEPTFVELVPPSVSRTNECLVELEDPHGMKMRIQLKAAGAAELAALGQLFWRRER